MAPASTDLLLVMRTYVYDTRCGTGKSAVRPLLCLLLSYLTSVLLHVVWLNESSLRNPDVINLPVFVTTRPDRGEKVNG
jgi:hypothetical protein